MPVNSIRAGNVIDYNGKLWVASKVQHISPGKGGAFVAIEAKALREGNKLQERFRSGEMIEQAHIEERDCTFLFGDDTGFTFMDKENYEQLVVGSDVLDP
ncbi:MAG TPA: elongation factor P, partial [Reyranella sp.]